MCLKTLEWSPGLLSSNELKLICTKKEKKKKKDWNACSKRDNYSKLDNQLKRGRGDLHDHLMNPSIFNLVVMRYSYELQK